MNLLKIILSTLIPHTSNERVMAGIEGMVIFLAVYDLVKDTLSILTLIVSFLSVTLTFFIKYREYKKDKKV